MTIFIRLVSVGTSEFFKWVHSSMIPRIKWTASLCNGSTDCSPMPSLRMNFGTIYRGWSLKDSAILESVVELLLPSLPEFSIKIFSDDKDGKFKDSNTLL